jgi:hypothetical protein
MRTWSYLAGLALVAVGLALLSESGAQEKPRAAALPADLARVPVKGFLLASIRPADLWDSELGKGVRVGLGKEEQAMAAHIQEATGLPPADLERVTLVFTTPQGEPLVFCRSTRRLDGKKVLARLVPGGKPDQYAGQEYLASERRAAFLLGDQEFVVGTKGDIQSLLDSKPEKKVEGLAAAVALAAKKHSLVIGLNPGVLPNIPDEEIGPFRPLLKADGASLAVDLGGKLTGNLRVRFTSTEDAEAGQKALETARKMGLEAMSKLPIPPAAKEVFGQLQDAIKASKLTRDGKELTASLEMKLEAEKTAKAGLLLVQKMRDSARRAQSANNLKQIGLALHNYADQSQGTLPPSALFDKNGKPLLSWRVLILPYIEQDDLYKQFKLNEPWDSAHNKKLLAKMPSTFKAPIDRPVKPGYTFYQAFVGKSAAFEGKKGMRLPADFPDGLSNTIWVAEAATPVPWTKPEDLAYAADKPVPKLGGLFEGGFNAAFADGAVRFFSKSMAEQTLRAYITRNGGEVIREED